MYEQKNTARSKGIFLRNDLWILAQQAEFHLIRVSKNCFNHQTALWSLSSGHASLYFCHIIHKLHSVRALWQNWLSINLWLMYSTADFYVLCLFLAVIASLPTSPMPQLGTMMPWDWPSRRPMTIDASFRHLPVRWRPSKELWVSSIVVIKPQTF